MPVNGFIESTSVVMPTVKGPVAADTATGEAAGDGDSSAVATAAMGSTTRAAPRRASAERRSERVCMCDLRERGDSPEEVVPRARDARRVTHVRPAEGHRCC